MTPRKKLAFADYHSKQPIIDQDENDHPPRRSRRLGVFVRSYEPSHNSPALEMRQTKPASDKRWTPDMPLTFDRAGGKGASQIRFWGWITILCLAPTLFYLSLTDLPAVQEHSIATLDTLGDVYRSSNPYAVCCIILSALMVRLLWADIWATCRSVAHRADDGIKAFGMLRWGRWGSVAVKMLGAGLLAVLVVQNMYLMVTCTVQSHSPPVVYEPPRVCEGYLTPEHLDAKIRDAVVVAKWEWQRQDEWKQRDEWQGRLGFAQQGTCPREDR